MKTSWTAFIWMANGALDFSFFRFTAVESVMEEMTGSKSEVLFSSPNPKPEKVPVKESNDPIP